MTGTCYNTNKQYLPLKKMQVKKNSFILNEKKKLKEVLLRSKKTLRFLIANFTAFRSS